jgi:hypothetical protein
VRARLAGAVVIAVASTWAGMAPDPGRPGGAVALASPEGARPVSREAAGAPEDAPADGSAGAPADTSAGGAIEDIDLAVIAGQGGAQGDTWRELPGMAERVREAMRAAGGQGAAVRVWGDPSLGCFVAVMQVDGGGALLHRAIGQALAGPDAAAGDTAAGRFSIDGWQSTERGGVLTSRFTMAAGAVRGQARVVSSTRSGAASGTPSGASSGTPSGASSGTPSSAPAVPVTRAAACFYTSREPTLSARLCDRLLPSIALQPEVQP